MKSLVLFFSHFMGNLCDFLFFLFLIFSVFYVKGIKRCSYIEWKMSSLDKFSKSLHYFFWRNGEGNFSIILKCEWLYSKSPHYQCPKITFKLLFSWLLHDGSSHQHPIIGKKINMVSWHNLTTSTKVISPVFAIIGIFLLFFFCIPCNFISFKEKEMELNSYINPLGVNPTKWSNTCKISFIFTALENVYSESFQKPVIHKNRSTRNTIF